MAARVKNKSKQERMDYALMTAGILRLLSSKRKVKESMEMKEAISKTVITDAHRLLQAVETCKKYHKSWGGEENFLCIAAIEANSTEELLDGFLIPSEEVLAEYFYYLIDTNFPEVFECSTVQRGLGIAHLPDKEKFKVLKDWWEAHLNLETATAFLEQANFN